MKTLRNAFLISISCFFLFSCQMQNSSEKMNDSQTGKLKIKSCKIYSYKINMQSDKEEGILMEEFEYDLNGRATKLVRYDSTGKVICTFNYKYDQSGNLTEKIWREASGIKNEESRSTTLSYDLGGASLKEKTDTGKNEKYDQSGKLIERIWNDPVKKSEIKETHHYYQDGKEREVEFFNDKNELEKKTVYAYDSLGNEVSVIAYNKEKIVESKITYVYDEYGNIKEDIYWNVQDSVPSQIIRYVYEFY